MIRGKKSRFALAARPQLLDEPYARELQAQGACALRFFKRKIANFEAQNNSVALHRLGTDFETDLNGSIEETVLDAASLLKQWLRELPEPLIPVQFHDIFLKCCKLTDEKKILGKFTA